MSEIDRLYQLKQILMNRRFIGRDELMSRLEISRATLTRDLAKLRDQLQVPVVFDKELSGYRLNQTDDRMELPGFWFSQDEILALMTIHSVIDQLDLGALKTKLSPFRARLNELLISRDVDPGSFDDRVRLVNAGRRQLPSGIFEKITKALFERQQIKISHFSRATNETTDRIISPQQLVNYRDNWYVDAWCHLRNGLRTFSIDAIHDAEVVDTAATEVNLNELRDLMTGGYGIFGGRPKDVAVLKFSAKRAAWVKSEIWHINQESHTETDGSYVLKVPYSDERELVGDLLRFGSDLTVLGPESLKLRLKEELKLTLKQFEA